jgi:hypothetical protein
VKHLPRLVALVAACCALLGVVSTYDEFNNMYDEPAHIAAGMEWLSRGQYQYDPQQPPLSRIPSALLPWLAGERSQGNQNMFVEGRRILGRGEHYERTLMLARLGQLPFLAILLATTWAWARRISDERTAAVAVVFAAANPNLLAHAGIAGTDIAPAALMPLALLAWVIWLERPGARASIAMGLAVAACGLAKFSAVAFWIVAATLVALMAARATPSRFFGLAGARQFGRPSVIAGLAAALLTWAFYRFSFGPVRSWTLPAPDFWSGLDLFFARGARGHPSFLLGEVRETGWWYFDLVVLAVKTPVPLLVFGALGAWLALRYRRELGVRALVAGSAAVILVASLTRVDLGVRLLLALYPMLAILAALAVTWTWERAARASNRFVVGAFMAWTVVDPIAVHPDHLAYFNVLAGPRPERILVDSNLDWGQDLYRLRQVTRAIGTDSLRIHYFGTAEFMAVGLERTRRLAPNERPTGWVAASETFYAGVWADTSLHWLRQHEPVARVGRSIRLYRIP